MKLSSGLGKVDTVIVNGAECEPYITSDDRLMRESPERVAGGLRVIMKILQPRRTAVGIEANKPEAIAAMKQALGEDVELLSLRVRYPQGAESSSSRPLPAGAFRRAACPPMLAAPSSTRPPAPQSTTQFTRAFPW